MQRESSVLKQLQYNSIVRSIEKAVFFSKRGYLISDGRIRQQRSVLSDRYWTSAQAATDRNSGRATATGAQPRRAAINERIIHVRRNSRCTINCFILGNNSRSSFNYGRRPGRTAAGRGGGRAGPHPPPRARWPY
ncbi:hypothetical protein EVAR_52173_1 [Eumeta japonica]|uniref:Uncharacterized protein n=1 Tax=Eumeta variegata TaxID=151549 RepID=A0A4C1YED6_EUMVA|nr:hypothetical protein EVAR_52173_1 [Eumeta japonica]